MIYFLFKKIGGGGGGLGDLNQIKQSCVADFFFCTPLAQTLKMVPLNGLGPSWNTFAKRPHVNYYILKYIYMIIS